MRKTATEHHGANFPPARADISAASASPWTVAFSGELSQETPFHRVSSRASPALIFIPLVSPGHQVSDYTHGEARDIGGRPGSTLKDCVKRWGAIGLYAPAWIPAT